jgi:iron complex transport system substrate-binding protein
VNGAAALLAVALALSGAPVDDAPARRAHLLRPDPTPPAPAKLQRIVSLAPVLTETLFAVGAGDRVVGVTRFCDRPAAAAKLPKVGGFVDPQLERIVALKPDLVVAMPSFGQRAVLERLRDRGVPVLVAFGDTVDEVRDLIAAVGRTVGAPDAARAVRRRLEDGLTAAQASARARRTHPRVVIVFHNKPLVVAGAGTFPDEALRLAGARPVAPRHGPQWPTWSLEALLLAKPDVVVAAEGPDAAAELRAVLAATAVGRRVRVVASAAPILMRPGPTLHEDVAELVKLLREPPAR